MQSLDASKGISSSTIGGEPSNHVSATNSDLAARWPAFALLGTRIALAAAFFSAVADRFGLWGAPGQPGIAWGSFDAFLDYTGQVLSFLPSALAPLLGIVATALEVVLAIALLVGFRLRWTALASGLLLASFALSMTLSFGLKAPLDYSVASAAGAAFLLAAFSTSDRRGPSGRAG